jgi:hypothetical protein
LLAFELHRIALVQGLVSIFLDSGEVYEDILPGGTLDKSISFRSVEPLDHTVFLQAKSLSRCFESGETITPIGLPNVRNNELLFKLDDVMAGIGIQCKKNLPYALELATHQSGRHRTRWVIPSCMPS